MDCTDRCSDRSVPKYGTLAEAQLGCAQGAVVTCVTKGRGLEAAYYCDAGAEAPCLVVTHDQVRTSHWGWVVDGVAATPPSS
jgi:hypothetical protein